MTEPPTVQDPLAAAAEPHCPECGTVLRPAGPGYWCATCRLAYTSV